MGFAFFDLHNEGKLEAKSYMLPVICGFFFFLAFYTPWKYFKNAPTIIIDSRNIKFGEKIYSLSDIKKVVLTGKIPFKYFVSYPMEGVTVEFKTGQVEFIFNDMYSNTWELKSHLEKLVSAKNDDNAPKKAPLPITKNPTGHVVEFNGNHALSFNGIMLYGWIGFFVWLFITGDNNPFDNLGALIVLPIIFVSVPAVFSYQMHYFLLTGKNLVVRNSIWFWRKDSYEITDVREVVFEIPHRLSTSMRIITTDFRDKLYPAGNLNDKTWLKLKTELEKNGVTVRNEAIF